MQDAKVVNVIPPVAIVDDASWTTTEIDTLGYDYCTIYINLGATDVAMAALKVQESDETGTGFADVTGLVYGTSTLPEADGGATSSLPSATDDSDVFAFFIDLRGRKRFLDVVATAGNGTSGTFASGIAVLTRAEQKPVLATDRGLNANLIK